MSKFPTTALITGAAGGIGSSLARQLVAGGTKLVLAGRTLEPLKKLAEELGAISVVCDMCDPDQVESLVEKSLSELGEIQAAAHCVGSILLKPAHLTSIEDWQNTMNLNLNSAFYFLKSLARPMQKSGGAIAFVSSVAAEKGLANHEAIAAAKAGLAGMTRAAAATYASAGLRINCVAPGLTDTPLAKPITGNESARKFSEQMHPLGRLGEADEVANALAFLLSPENSWITGQSISIDGGLSTLQKK